MRLFFGLITILLFTNFFCDGLLIVRGTTVEQRTIMGEVTSVESDQIVDSVKVAVFPFVENNRTIHTRVKRESFSDENGLFQINQTTSPYGKQFGALIATKQGYYPDTIYFEYKSGDTVKVKIKLKSLEQ